MKPKTALSANVEDDGDDNDGFEFTAHSARINFVHCRYCLDELSDWEDEGIYDSDSDAYAEKLALLHYKGQCDEENGVVRGCVCHLMHQQDDIDSYRSEEEDPIFGLFESADQEEAERNHLTMLGEPAHVNDEDDRNKDVPDLVDGSDSDEESEYRIYARRRPGAICHPRITQDRLSSQQEGEQVAPTHVLDSGAEASSVIVSTGPEVVVSEEFTTVAIISQLNTALISVRCAESLLAVNGSRVIRTEPVEESVAKVDRVMELPQRALCRLILVKEVCEGSTASAIEPQDRGSNKPV
jgi:hypothetical protein